MTSRASGPDCVSRRRVLLLAAALGVAACGKGDDVRTDPGNLHDAGGVADVSGVPVHYLRRGSGSPVILVHGASSNLRDWTMGAFDALAERHDVIAFDRAGLGRSGWPGPAGARLTEQARLMQAASRQLGVSQAIVVGHSYGGSVALKWALEAPATVSGRLLIAAPSQVWPGGLGLSTDLLANPLTGPALARAIPALLPRSVAERAAARVFAPQAAPPGYLEHLGVDLVLRPTTLRANALQLAALKDQIRVMLAGYPEIAMPVELIHGMADETVPLAIHSEPLTLQIPHARLTRLAGVGHMPHHVALPEVLAAVARLAAVAERQAGAAPPGSKRLA